MGERRDVALAGAGREMRGQAGNPERQPSRLSEPEPRTASGSVGEGFPAQLKICLAVMVVNVR